MSGAVEDLRLAILFDEDFDITLSIHRVIKEAGYGPESETARQKTLTDYEILAKAITKLRGTK
jgi:hypothetical protein